ncbi:MAG: N-acyl homoserine lactonase family protein [Chloroflexota bacterium]|nr:N-acyl homoserine lactonase family protein [Chloroflexota bacterium]
MTATPAPARLYLFPTATAMLSLGGRSVAWSAGCYLIQLSDGRNLLVDSGPPPDFSFGSGMPPVAHGPNVIDRLAGLGLEPGDIDVLICSHFDIDHVGYHAAFTNAELVVQRAHHAAARDGHPRFAMSRPHWDLPGRQYRLIDGDAELLPGLRLIATSGHVPGHQSVLVRLPNTGPVLLAIDAVAMAFVFTPERPPMPWLDEDQPALVASTQTLIDLVATDDVALVVFHHDGAQWERLKRAPDWYD